MAFYNILHRLGSSETNMAKNTVYNETIKGTPEKGISPTVLDTLLQLEETELVQLQIKYKTD